jgi:hypothetical protein
MGQLRFVTHLFSIMYRFMRALFCDAAVKRITRYVELCILWLHKSGFTLSDQLISQYL